MDKVLVIGASGLLGNKAVELGSSKCSIFGTFNTHPIKGSNFFRLNVANRQEIFKLIEKAKPDLVLDTHALNNVDYCETHPEETWAVNVEGTKNVAEASQRVGAKYVFISTDYVFDGKKLGYTEKDKPHPLNYYAKTKLAAEMSLDALDINYIVARTAVIYGIGGKGKVPFVNWIIDKLRRNENVNIVSDQYNNPTLADNLVEVIFKLFEMDAKGTFHVTGSECVSRYDFAKEVAKTFNLNPKFISPVTTPELNQTARRPAKVNMNVNKTERVTGMKMMNVGEGLKLLKKQMGG